MIGPWHFGQEAVSEVEVPNRDLLVEFCYATDLTVANTFKNLVEEENHVIVMLSKLSHISYSSMQNGDRW